MSDDRHNAPRAGRRANFLYLFAALLVLTIVGPVVEVAFGMIGGLFAEVSLSLTLVIALWSMQATRRGRASGTAATWREYVAHRCCPLGHPEKITKLRILEPPGRGLR